MPDLSLLHELWGGLIGFHYIVSIRRPSTDFFFLFHPAFLIILRWGDGPNYFVCHHYKKPNSIPCFLKAHLGMFKMHLVFGFIDFYSLKRGFSISRDDTRIVQPHWRAARCVAGYLINPALIFLGYWRKTCWAVDFLCGGRRNWLSHTAALLQVLRVPLPRVLSSAARATARCLGTATVTECAPLINHENSNGTVTEPWNGSSELLQDVQVFF